LDYKIEHLESVITKEVLITINKWNIDHFKKLEYENLIINHKLIVPIKHLMKNSSVKVDCCCSLCGHIQNTTFQKYMKNYERCNFYSCKHCNNETLKITMMKKYGVENCAILESTIEKKKNTCRERYGVDYAIISKDVKEKIKIYMEYDHPMKIEETKNIILEKGRNTKIKNGFIVPDEKLSDWNLYRRNVRKLTERNRKTLLKNWNGFDFYDNEYIKDNFSLKHIDKNYPTLDHKISIFFGFKNNISPEDISDISNLCITKRIINSTKKENNYYIK